MRKTCRLEVSTLAYIGALIGGFVFYMLSLDIAALTSDDPIDEVNVGWAVVFALVFVINIFITNTKVVESSE